MTNFNLFFSEAGVLPDPEPHLLPPGGLNYIQNLRFRDGSLERVGFYHKQEFNTPIVFDWALSVRTAVGYIWVVAQNNPGNLHGLFGNIVQDIGRGTAYSNTGRWIGGLLNGIPVLANGRDVPQCWLSPGISTKFQNLPNWPATQQAYIIRPFGTVLVALGMRINGNEFPYRVKTSHPADPGSLPVSWDEADPTRDVLQFDLADTSDLIVDGGKLRSFFVIYKENTTHLLTPFGGSSGSGFRSLFRVQQAFAEAGLLNRNCFTDFGNKHFVVTDQDIIVHDGSSAQGIVDARLRKWFFNNLNFDYLDKCFVVNATRPGYPPEIHICFVRSGEDTVRWALVWNIADDQWTIRNSETEVFNYIARGYSATAAFSSSETWDGDDTSWDSDLSSWDGISGVINSRQFPILLGLTAQSGLGLYDFKEPTEQGDQTVLLERCDFPFGSFTSNGQLVPEYERFKLYRWVRPFIDAPRGSQFYFEFGGRNSLSEDDPIQWHNPQIFTVGRDDRVDLWLRTRYLSYRIRPVSDAIPFKITGMNMDLVLKGRW